MDLDLTAEQTLLRHKEPAPAMIAPMTYK